MNQPNPQNQQQPQPQPQPLANSPLQSTVITLNEDRNVTLSVYLQGVGDRFRIGTRPAVIVIPGGGYQYCAEHEAEPVALAFMRAGYHAFVLRYSVAEHAGWPNQLDDYEQAMSFIRAHADDWGIIPDRIAVCGFSAGGHLAGAAATMSNPAARPNAAILGYPALLGSSIQGCDPAAPDVVDAVDVTTCPCFVFGTRDDALVSVSNLICMSEALADNGISFESHIYAFGPHGFGAATPSVTDVSKLSGRALRWLDDALDWLGEIFGTLTLNGMTQPRCLPHVSADYESSFSLDCTFGYLRTNEQVAAVMRPFLDWFDEHYLEVAASIGPAMLHLATTQGKPGFYAIGDARTMREILDNTPFDDAYAADLAAALAAIDKQ
ncbi:alpha/beta hydrolase [Bifidobacterium tissieri]|uniref:Alpha/beta hydrolase n=1 Tax=Bifidobacterium tissieri TaxID=1630162 RepID=A0A5M9ZUJ0_9BIFI|nr:alpha/beta hydrolase [Bifidobacterium tissieri]KAA8831168.1 alpha/beta hydrolase [Bifidobacterium tissieri]KAA8833177.1 alpha/beta hydrolase [Bifidobacterium tissieri]